MAQLALGIAGAVVGGFIGGPVGAQIGWVLGSAIGGILDPPKQEGPRLSDLRLQKSSYGGMIPLIYGTIRTQGNVIWQTDLIEHKQKSGGKGGGPEITNYTYSASFAIGLCEGPIVDILRVWANGRLVFDKTQGSDFDAGDFQFTLYLGTEVQTPDPTMQAEIGATLVPGYRGLAYVVFTDLTLTDFGNSIPNLEFEVVTKSLSGCAMRRDLNVKDLTPIWGDAGTVRPIWTTRSISSGVLRLTNIGNGSGGTADTVSDATYMYDLETLASLGIDTSQGTASQSADQYPRYYTVHGNDMPSSPGFGSDTTVSIVGMYVMSDGTEVPLWRKSSVVTAPSNTVDVAIGTAMSALPDTDAPSGFNGNLTYCPGGDWLAQAGVPGGYTVWGGCFNISRRALFIFTDDPINFTPGDGLRLWFKIVNGIVTDDGTCTFITSTDIPMRWGVNEIPGEMSAEPNGKYFWYFNSVSNQVKIYIIDDDGNFAYSASCGTSLVQNTEMGGLDPFSLGTVLAFKNGFAVANRVDALAIFARFPEGQSDEMTLAEIVSDLSVSTPTRLRGGLGSSDIDVTDLPDIVKGFIVTQQAPIRTMLQPLIDGYFVDAAEVDDVILWKHRGKPSIATIPDDDLAAHESGSELPAPLNVVRTQEEDLPAFINVDYMNAEADYQTGTQNAERQITSSKSNRTVTLPIAMNDLKAKAVATSTLFEAWYKRDKGNTLVPMKWAKLTPMDVIDVKGREWAIKNVGQTPTGVIKLDMEPSLGAIYAQPGVSTASPGIGGSEILSKAATDLLLLDIPLIADADHPNGFYAAVAKQGTGTWSGVSLQKSVDGGSNYAETASIAVSDAIGETSDVLGNFFGGNIVDESNSVTVVLSAGSLSGTTYTGLLNGVNGCVVGYEVMQFRDAALVGADTYLLSGLQRGRRGTEWAMTGHEVGERFCLLPTNDVDAPLPEIGLSRLYKPVTYGRTLAQTVAQSFTNTGQRLAPYSPVQLGGGADAAGDVTLNWTRRTRIGGEWRDGVDVPLSEASESYVVQIWDASYTICARIISGITNPTVGYTAANQTTDFGAAQQHIYFTVGQIGQLGIGVQSRGIATGTGASDVLPLSPIAPYTSGPLNPPPSGAVDVTLTWTPTAPVYAGFVIGQTYVAKFTTAAGTPTTSVSVAEYGSAPIFRHVKMCTDSAGLNLVPGTESYGTTATAGPVVLAAMTDYFVIIRAELANGNPSGPLGQNANMVISLSHT